MDDASRSKAPTFSIKAVKEKRGIIQTSLDTENQIIAKKAWDALVEERTLCMANSINILVRIVEHTTTIPRHDQSGNVS